MAKKKFYSRPKTFDGKLYKAVKANGSCVGCAFHMNCDNRMFSILEVVLLMKEQMDKM